MSMERISQQRDIRLRFALMAAILVCSPLLHAQEKLAYRIDDEVTRFAFSANGRIAYAVRHEFTERNIQLQRDDVWVAESDGKKRRILQGEKFVRGTGPFSYLVRGLRWAPDGTRLTIEIATSEMINANGDTRDGISTLLLDDSGSELPIGSGDSLIPDATNAAWLADNATVVFLSAVKPEMPRPLSEKLPSNEKLFTVGRVPASGGPATGMFQAEKFVNVEWNPSTGIAMAVVREPDAMGSLILPGPADLVVLDLVHETSRDLAPLQNYAGGLSVSPSGEKVAYWVANDQLEVRDIAHPDRLTRVHAILGTLGWSADEKRVVVKQGAAARPGSLVWILLPELSAVAPGSLPIVHTVAFQSLLHSLEYRAFEISRDGKWLAVVEPGRRNLLVYSLL